MRRISEDTKLKRGYGTGEFEFYKPFVAGREFNSSGTVTQLKDYKTGRTVELLSRGEMHYWYLLRFDPNVVEIREQYPLDLKETVKLAELFGIKHPRNKSTHMTTDFLIQYSDGHFEAHSFKSTRKMSDRTKEKLFLEHKYWQTKNIPYRLAFGDDMDVIRAENIRMCSYYYEKSCVYDELSCVKHMIITRRITPDLSRSLIIPKDVLQMYYEEVSSEWEQIKKTKLEQLRELGS